MTDADDTLAFGCPVPATHNDTIQLAHGGGGRAMARLIDEIIRPTLDDAELDRRHDGAVLSVAGPIAFTTDSYVVQPLVFPGGDIGSLAVNGTVNDLAMCGARPSWLSVGLILEAGLPLEVLRRMLASMRAAATAAGVRLVTGDTKVVDRGKADGMFVNTAGIGQVVARRPIGPREVRPGDAVILSADIGRHGIAVMAARESLGFEHAIQSDCASVVAPVLGLIEAGVDVHCLRDLTRGGLASALNEIAAAADVAIGIDERAIVVRPEVVAACELLGLDALHVANEGCFVAFVAAEHSARAVDVLRSFPQSADAATIGEVRSGPAGIVACRGALGVERIVDMLNGEQLPRIC
jgi:hydrogenase expression/formation protein HypE